MPISCLLQLPHIGRRGCENRRLDGSGLSPPRLARGRSAGGQAEVRRAEENRRLAGSTHGSVASSRRKSCGVHLASANSRWSLASSAQSWPRMRTTCGGAEHLAAGAGHALEQEWLGRAGQLVVRIEAGNQRDRRPFSGVSADDGHDDVGELGRHRYDPLPVGLRQGDHQERDDLAVGPLTGGCSAASAPGVPRLGPRYDAGSPRAPTPRTPSAPCGRRRGIRAAEPRLFSASAYAWANRGRRCWRCRRRPVGRCARRPGYRWRTAPCTRLWLRSVLLMRTTCSSRG